MALVLPVLLLLLLGMAEFGRMTHAYLSVIHAAREGLRLGVTGASDTEVEARVRSQAAGLDPAQLEITITPAGSPRTPGSDLSVAVRYPVRLITPLVSQVLGGGTVNVGVELTSRVE